MGMYVKMVLDSIGPCDRRLITIESNYWRGIHDEVLTHRDRERNAGSSRAIPWMTARSRIVDEPFIPIAWGTNQRGMQIGEPVSPEVAKLAEASWLRARDACVVEADYLANTLGLHKNYSNRLVQNWSFITVVMTATEWKNFFRLRCHPDAEIHFQALSNEIRRVIEESEPTRLKEGEWHLPYCDQEDWNRSLNKAGSYAEALEMMQCWSTARCARVSIKPFNADKRNWDQDLDVYSKLRTGSGFGHWSPFGHLGRAEKELVKSGPFTGWTQYRKLFVGLENVEG